MVGPARWLLLAGAGVVVALTAFTDGPLGAWPVLGRHAHRAVDWAVVALLAASPLAPGRDAVSILVLEAGAVLLWRLTGLTRYDAPARTDADAPAEPRPPPGPAVAPRAAAAPGPAVDPDVERAVRRQARKAGLAVGILQRRARAGRRQT